MDLQNVNSFSFLPKGPEHQNDQISSKLRDLDIELMGMAFNLEQLCRNVLVTGQIGSGKTLSVINPLASAIVDASKEPERKGGCFYINAKGEGHLDFIKRLPPERAEDVRLISEGSDNRLVLLPDTGWAPRELLAEAAAAFLPEFARLLVGTTDRVGNHKAFFERLTDIVLRTAACVWMHARTLSPRPPFACDSAFHGVLNTAVAFCKYFTCHDDIKRSEQASGAGERNIFASDFEGFKSSGRLVTNRDRLQVLVFLRKSAEKLNQKLSETGESVVWQNTLRTLLGTVEFLANQTLHEVPCDWEGKDDVEIFQKVLDSMPERQFQELRQLISPIRHDGRNNSYFESVAVEIFGIASEVNRPGMARFFEPNCGTGTVCFEELLDEGRIFVLDVQGQTGAARTAAILALHYFCQAVSERLRLTRPGGVPINRERPVVLCADEFHMYATLGRTSGLGHFLAISRSAGCIAILSAQSVGLITKALGDQAACDMLLADLATRIFGANTSSTTNQLSSELCGQGRVTTMLRQGLIYHSSKRLEEVMNQSREDHGWLVTPDKFPQLLPGQFIVRRYDGLVGLWDLRWNNPEAGFSSIGTASLE